MNRYSKPVQEKTIHPRIVAEEKQKFYYEGKCKYQPTHFLINPLDYVMFKMEVSRLGYANIAVGYVGDREIITIEGLTVIRSNDVPEGGWYVV